MTIGITSRFLLPSGRVLELFTTASSINVNVFLKKGQVNGGNKLTKSMKQILSPLCRTFFISFFSGPRSLLDSKGKETAFLTNPPLLRTAMPRDDCCTLIPPGPGFDEDGLSWPGPPACCLVGGGGAFT